MTRYVCTAVLFVLAIFAAGCDFPSGSIDSPNNACKLQNETLRAQADANKASMQQHMAAQAAIEQIQLAVAHACLDKGGQPEFINQNVTCRK
jgi:hypothetical protein